MSATAIAWLLLVLSTVSKGFYRPSLLVCTYLITFYVSPAWWWWGKSGPLSSVTRWNFYAAILLGIGVLLNQYRSKPLQFADRCVIALLLIYLANCTIVHYFFADNPDVSFREWDVLWKNIVIAILIRLAIRDRDDLHWVIGVSVACCGYVGYEIVFNDAGKSIKGRLEGLGFSGAEGSNGCATIMSMMFPFLAYLVICNPFKYSRILGLLTAPLILDSVLRFNSRGSFLGAGVAGLVLLLMARGKTRTRVFFALLLGIAAFLFQAQDPKIWERLFSIGASAEERDASAGHRLETWKAGLQMIADHPFGSGGRSAFVSPRGDRYIAYLGYNEFRSVHNGFISIAAGWGIQGFLLLTIAFSIAITKTWQSIQRFQELGNESMVFLGASIIGAFFGQATCAMFGDYYDGEWFFWLAFYGMAFSTFAQSEVETPEQDIFRSDQVNDNLHQHGSPSLSVPLASDHLPQ